MYKKIRFLIFSLIFLLIVGLNYKMIFIEKTNETQEEKTVVDEDDGYIKMNLAENYIVGRENPEFFKNNKIRIRGVVYEREEEEKETEKSENKHFYIIRVLLVCCYADSIPIVIKVNTHGEVPEPDQWIDVYGSVSVEKIDEENINVEIELEKYNKLDPKNISRGDVYIFQVKREKPFSY